MPLVEPMQNIFFDGPKTRSPSNANVIIRDRSYGYKSRSNFPIRVVAWEKRRKGNGFSSEKLPSRFPSASPFRSNRSVVRPAVVDERLLTTNNYVVTSTIIFRLRLSPFIAIIFSRVVALEIRTPMTFFKSSSSVW